MGSSYAFSPLGYSGSYAGFGDTEATRANTAVKYHWNSPFLPSRDEFPLGRPRAMGSYNQGNGTTYVSGSGRRRLPHLFGGSSSTGTLSVDSIGGYAQNAANIGTFTGYLRDAQVRSVQGPNRLHLGHPGRFTITTT